MNMLQSTDQTILRSLPFISPIPDSSICFLIKIQGICENAFGNNHQDISCPCIKE